MRAVFAVAVAVVVVVNAACDGEGEGEGEGEGDVAKEGVCGRVDLVDGSTAPDDFGEVVVEDARVEGLGFVTVNFAGGRTLLFPVSPSRPPSLPPPGPATLHAGQADCFGEGCDTAFWALVDDAGVPWFEVGTANAIDDGPVRGPGPDEHVTFRLATDDEVCGVSPAEGGGGDGIAVGVVSTDDGDVIVKAGATKDVVIGGAEFAVAVGGAERDVVVVEDIGPCADCAAPGDYVFTSIGVVLYRKAP